MQVLVPYAAHVSPPAARGRVVGTVMGGLMFGVMLARPVSSFITPLTSWRRNRPVRARGGHRRSGHARGRLACGPGLESTGDLRRDADRGGGFSGDAHRSLRFETRAGPPGGSGGSRGLRQLREGHCQSARNLRARCGASRAAEWAVHDDLLHWRRHRLGRRGLVLCLRRMEPCLLDRTRAPLLALAYLLTEAGMGTRAAAPESPGA